MVARVFLRCLVTVVGSILMIGCLCGECDEVAGNKELVADVFEIVESGDLDRLDEYIATDYVRHCQATPDIEVTSLEGLKEFLVNDRQTVPNPKLTVTRLVAEDDLVAFWATYSGIQEGPMGPFPATGGLLELDFAGMHRINDGKIVETWVIWDNLTGLTQLGFYPPEMVETLE
jgi:predicted ester cyclase